MEDRFEHFPKKKQKYRPTAAMKNAILRTDKQQRWEQRDLNPPQRISSETAHRNGQSAGLQQVGAPVGHQLSANPLVVIPVQLEPAILPSYTILPCIHSSRASGLSLSASTLSATQFLLAPLPTLIAGFFPST